jgi:short subunit dehydrogenase-like uncharacterized protein
MLKKFKYDFLVFGAGGMQGHIVVRDLISKKYKEKKMRVFMNNIQIN